jgi:HEPN domain-containing protein
MKRLKRKDCYMEIKKAAEWFLIAKEDEISANDLNKENTLNNSYYHCRQAAENYLKGFIHAHSTSINDNHEINETLSKCIKIDNSFSSILTECDNMEAIMNKIRYPGGIKATKKNIKDGLSLLNSIKQLEPIQDIFDTLKNKYGENWENGLFQNTLTTKTDNNSINNIKLKPMECIDYNPDKEILSRLNIIADERISFGSCKIGEKQYFNIEKHKLTMFKESDLFVLEARRVLPLSKDIYETWQFKEDFTKENAFEFIKQWNKEHSYDIQPLQSKNVTLKKTAINQL